MDVGSTYSDKLYRSTAELTPIKLYFKDEQGCAAGINHQRWSSFLHSNRDSRGPADVFHLERERKKKTCENKNKTNKKTLWIREHSCSVKRACWRYSLSAFCPLNVLDTLWRRSKAGRETWLVSRYDVALKRGLTKGICSLTVYYRLSFDQCFGRCAVQ